MSGDALDRADHLLDLGRCSQARDVVLPHVAEHPHDVRGLTLLAVAEIGLGDALGAQLATERLVAAAPDLDAAHRLRAAALGLAGLRADAVAAAEQAVRCGPSTWENHALLATTLVDRRRSVHRARAAANRAIELAPGQAEPFHALGVVEIEAERPSHAREALRRCLALDPQHADARRELAVLDGLARPAAAVRDLTGIAGSRPAGPGAEAALDAAVAVLLVRVGLLGLVALGAVLLVGGVLGGGGGGTSRAGVVVAVCLGAAWAGTAWWTARGLPAAAPSFLVRRAVRSSRLRLVAVAALVPGVVAVLAAVVPGAAAGAGVWLWRLLLLVGLGTAVWGMVRRRL